MTRSDADGRRWWILAVLGLAQLMVVLDDTVVSIALPSAQAALHFSDADRQWVVTAYSLGFGSLLLLGGRLSDLFGRRRVFLIGLVGFALASAVGGLANGLPMLLAARAVQGVFAALLAPALLSLLTTTFAEPKERGKAFGIFGAIAGSGAALGLLLGGVLTEYLSWRWCLFINLALAVFALIGGWILLEREPGRRTVALDIPGTLAVSGGLFMLVFGLSEANTSGWADPHTIAFLVIGGALLALFLQIQARSSHPVLPPRVLTDRNRAGAYTATFMVAAGMFGVFLFLTYYMQSVLRFSAVQAGLAFIPMCLCIMAASTFGSVLLSPRVSPKLMIPLGMTVAAVGMALFTRMAVNGNYAEHVLPASVVFGFGIGTVFGFASNTATREIDPADAGVGSAMVNVGQQIGAAIGTALLNTVAASATAGYLTSHHGPRPLLALQAQVHGYSIGSWVAAAIFAVGAVLTFAVLRPGVPGQAVPDPAVADDAAIQPAVA